MFRGKKTSSSPDCHHRQGCPRIAVSLLALDRFSSKNSHRDDSNPARSTSETGRPLAVLWHPSISVSSCPAVLCSSKVPLRRPVSFYVASSIAENPTIGNSGFCVQGYRLPLNPVAILCWSHKAHPAVHLRVWLYIVISSQPRHAQYSVAVDSVVQGPELFSAYDIAQQSARPLAKAVTASEVFTTEKSDLSSKS